MSKIIVLRSRLQLKFLSHRENWEFNQDFIPKKQQNIRLQNQISRKKSLFCLLCQTLPWCTENTLLLDYYCYCNEGKDMLSSLVGSSISSRLSELPQQRSINIPVYASLHWKQRVDWTNKLNNQLLSFIVLKVEYVSFSATDLSTGTQYWPFVLHVTSNQTLSKHTFKCF